MSDLPAIKYLDVAAKLANGSGWREIDDCIAIGELSASIIAHARTLEALAKYEPEPVDEDEAALLRIVNAWMRIEKTLDLRREIYPSDWANALAQYKAERPTITDDEARRIAREIAAKFAIYFSLVVAPSACCKGEMDHTNAFQFALAMVKRDPAALEAFRGVGRG